MIIQQYHKLGANMQGTQPQQFEYIKDTSITFKGIV